MSDFLKKGWHPKGKEGGKESWRGDFKGVNQVAGWMGKGKKPGEDSGGSTHISKPLATLKDPALFGPPPKNVNYHGGAALPNEITPHTSGLGAPLSRSEIESARQVRTPVQEEEVEVQRAPPPPLPFRSDRTGLSTSNLPVPPVRRVAANGGDESSAQISARASPNLPPRLPSRQNTTSPSISAAVPPPAYEATSHTNTPTLSLNPTAINRLGNAGVSVPAFNIGKSSSPSIESNPWQNEKSSPITNNSVSELQSRFKRMTSSEQTSTSNSGDTNTPPPAQRAPPSWKQTQASLRTAQNFHQNPSSVTLADAQQAANTAQSAHASAVDFRAKHSDKIDAAERKAHTLNKKYNVTGRLNKFLEDATEDEKHQTNQQQEATSTPNNHYQTPTQISSPPQLTHQTSYTQQQQQTPSQPSSYQRQSPLPPAPAPAPTPSTAIQSSQSQSQSTSSIAGRKPPPPPPPKKPASMQLNNSNAAAPPPIPLGTRPSFA